jgi:hypothetical protein
MIHLSYSICLKRNRHCANCKCFCQNIFEMVTKEITCKKRNINYLNILNLLFGSILLRCSSLYYMKLVNRIVFKLNEEDASICFEEVPTLSSASNLQRATPLPLRLTAVLFQCNPCLNNRFLCQRLLELHQILLEL